MPIKKLTNNNSWREELKWDRVYTEVIHVKSSATPCVNQTEQTSNKTDGIYHNHYLKTNTFSV